MRKSATVMWQNLHHLHLSSYAFQYLNSALALQRSMVTVCSNRPSPFSAQIQANQSRPEAKATRVIRFGGVTNFTRVLFASRVVLRAFLLYGRRGVIAGP
jgi:hypothetical protein